MSAKGKIRWCKSPQMGVSKNRGKTPQNGWWKSWKTLLKMDDLGGYPPIFGNIQITVPKIPFPEGLWPSPPSSSLSRTQPPAPAVQPSVLRAACHRGGWNSTAVLFKDVGGAVTLSIFFPKRYYCTWIFWIGQIPIVFVAFDIYQYKYIYIYISIYEYIYIDIYSPVGWPHTYIYIYIHTHTHSFWHFVHLSTFFVQTIPPCQLCSLYTTGGLCSWVSSPLPLWAFRYLWCRCSGNAPLLIRAECVLDMPGRVSWSDSVGRRCAESMRFFNLNASLVFISSGTSRFFFF